MSELDKLDKSNDIKEIENLEKNKNEYNQIPQNEEEIKKNIKASNVEDLRSLSFRSLIVGCLTGILVGAMNVNFGLRTGWTQGGSIFAAIIAIGIFKVINPSRPFTKYEATISTTAASAAGSMASTAGLVACMPALKLLGHQYSVFELYLWAISVAFFGVYFAVPIRRQMLEVEKLRFPSGRATAETIKAMFADGADTVTRAKVLIIVAILTATFTLLAFFIPYIEHPPMPAILAKWGWVIFIDPLLMGGGILAGPRACISLLLGAVFAWGILGPIIFHFKWVKGDVNHYDGVRGWILWLGVAIMTSESIVQLIFTAPMVFNGFVELIKRCSSLTKPNKQTKLEEEGNIPTFWWILGIILSTILLCFVGHFYFQIQFYFVLISIPLSALLSIIAARCAGETDINPVGGVGKVTQLVFAGLAPKQIHTNLLSAGIVAAGASQCGDMMQDLKTGYEIGVQPRKQFIAQMIGIVFGTITTIPIYKLFDDAYKIGGDQIPAPAAHAWKAVALILAEGFNALPKYSLYGIICGLIFGLILSFTHRILKYISPETSEYIPSTLAIGIGMIVPPKQSLTMSVGCLIFTIWKSYFPDAATHYFFAVSSGLISGSGLMGIVIAILKIMGVRPLL